MKDHDYQMIPDAGYLSRHGLSLGSRACTVCGLFESRDYAKPDCDSTFSHPGMVDYQEGRRYDPFAGYRHIRSGVLNPAIPGTWGSNVSIKSVDEHEETRPGLVEETIDRDAYNDFTRGL